MAPTNTANLVVIVTGCDTGFGSEIVDDLYKRGGYTIYATCLTEQAVVNYNAKQSSRLRALQVDVTKQDDVNRLRAQVEEECPQGVYCVLNNAGKGSLPTTTRNQNEHNQLIEICESKPAFPNI